MLGGFDVAPGDFSGAANGGGDVNRLRGGFGEEERREAGEGCDGGESREPAHGIPPPPRYVGLTLSVLGLIRCMCLRLGGRGVVRVAGERGDFGVL